MNTAVLLKFIQRSRREKGNLRRRLLNISSIAKKAKNIMDGIKLERSQSLLGKNLQGQMWEKQGGTPFRGGTSLLGRLLTEHVSSFKKKTSEKESRWAGGTQGTLSKSNSSKPARLLGGRNRIGPF